MSSFLKMVDINPKSKHYLFVIFTKVLNLIGCTHARPQFVFVYFLEAIAMICLSFVSHGK